MNKNYFSRLVDIFDRLTRRYKTINDLNVYGITGKNLKRLNIEFDLNGNFYLKPRGVCQSYTCMFSGRYLPRFIWQDDEAYFYFLPDLEKQPLNIKDISIYSINQENLFALIQDVFNVPVANKNIECIIPDMFWRIGICSKAGNVNLYIARKIKSNTGQILEALKNNPRPSLLLACSSVPSHVAWPSRCVVKEIKNLVFEVDGKLKVDFEWIKLLLDDANAEAPEELTGIRYDDEIHTLYIPNKPPWYITSERKRAIVAYLVAQYQKGRAPIKAQELISNTRAPGSYGGSTKFSQIFKDRAEYQDYIKQTEGKRGYYELSID